VSAQEAAYWRRVGHDWAGSPHGHLWRRHCDQVNAELLARWLPEAPVAALLKTDLFDEALSEGPLARLQTCAARVVGIDLSHPIAREAARRHPDLRALRADVRELPFADGSFDVVVSLSTLDHFQTEAELGASLRELGRVLRPGGTLLLTLDNPGNPVVRLRNALPFALLHRLGIVPYFVGVTRDGEQLTALLAQAGFVTDELTTVMHCLRIAAIPLCRIAERVAPAAAQSALVRGLLAFERLAKLPWRRTTGHFVAVRARKLSA
jgi:SAM-dependent methyltransferase